MTTPTGSRSPNLPDVALSTPTSWTDHDKAWALRDGQALALAYATIDFSGIGDLVQDLTCKPLGRKQRGLTVIDVLAACIALSLKGDAPQFRAIAELLHKGMPESERISRRITRPWPTASTPLAEARRMKRTAEEAVRRRFESLVRALDPYEGTRNHRTNIADLIEAAQQQALRDPDGATAAAKREQLLHLMNSLVQGTLDLVPSDLLGQMGSSFAIDGTFTPTWAASPKGHRAFPAVLAAARTVGSSNTSDTGAILGKVKRTADAIISADPEAGPYVRTNADGSDEYKGFGYEAHLAVVTDTDGKTGQSTLPSLVVGLSIDTPGFRPGPNAIEIANSVTNWAASKDVHFDQGVFDALYPTLGKDDFHLPLRELGIMPTFRLREDQLGSSSLTYEGTTLVEGSWYCSQMPAALVNASKDRIAHKISEAVYETRIAQRDRWRMYRVSGQAVLDDQGNPKDHRYMCPASMPGATVACPRNTAVDQSGGRTQLPLIPLSVRPFPSPMPTGKDGKPVLPPKACAQRTVQIPASFGIGKEQAHPYMSQEWRATNNRYRSSNEGKNGSLKDPTAERIGTKGVRRVNGMAANGILLACQVAASNLRATGNFLNASDTGDDGRLIRRYPSRGQRPVTAPRGSRPGAGPTAAGRRPSASAPQRAASARARS